MEEKMVQLEVSPKFVPRHPSMEPDLQMFLLSVFRYRSFTNWVKTFDEYQRQASKKDSWLTFENQMI